MTLEEIRELYPPYQGKVRPNLIDETGNVYGRLTVLYRSINSTKDKKAKWVCQCSCGNICEATGKEMRAGKITTCGCGKVERFSQLNAIDIVGKRYGKLTVLRKTEERDNQGRVLWECVCDCGNTKKVSTISLQSGNTKSCGCMRSYGEFLTKKVLQDLGLRFIEQYTFSDLSSFDNERCKLKFDFGVLDENDNLSFLIEFDGEQHFTEYPQWHVPFESDQRKNKYCEEHNIPLLRISYTDRNYEAICAIINNFRREALPCS